MQEATVNDMDVLARGTRRSQVGRVGSQVGVTRCRAAGHSTCIQRRGIVLNRCSRVLRIPALLKVRLERAQRVRLLLELLARARAEQYMIRIGKVNLDLLVDVRLEAALLVVEHIVPVRQWRELLVRRRLAVEN